MLTRFLALSSLVVTTVLLATSSATAAPQILGLLATKVPQPLLCGEHECSADLASFCLQPNRGEPWPGHPYRAAKAAGISLVVHSAGGRTTVLPATPHVRFEANIAMTAVRVFVDRRLLDRLGAKHVAFRVDPGVSLIPVAKPDDSNPITAREIAAATGPARSIAAQFFENGEPVGDTARLTAAMLSQTPEVGNLTAFERGNLWRNAVGIELKNASSTEGLGGARDHYDACLAAVDVGTHHSMRSCLEYRHGAFMRKQNEMLRRALRSGW